MRAHRIVEIGHADAPRRRDPADRRAQLLVMVFRMILCQNGHLRCAIPGKGDFRVFQCSLRLTLAFHDIDRKPRPDSAASHRQCKDVQTGIMIGIQREITGEHGVRVPNARFRLALQECHIVDRGDADGGA